MSSSRAVVGWSPRQRSRLLGGTSGERAEATGSPTTAGWSLLRDCKVWLVDVTAGVAALKLRRCGSRWDHPVSGFRATAPENRGTVVEIGSKSLSDGL